MHFSKHDIEQMPSRYRAHFINSLSGYKSANLVGTADHQGRQNLAIVSSVVHLGAQPPLVGMIMRPDVVERHTLANIRETGWYTLNQVHQSFWQQAHQTSAKYPAGESEFSATGLTAEFIGDCPAPSVAESQLCYSVKLLSEQPIEYNGTIMLIGEIEQVVLKQPALFEDGHIDLNSLQTVAVAGLDGYHVGHALGRLQYAQPDSEPTVLEAKCKGD
ncbi:flavin reductase [Pseudoalteromonas sp. CNC9-20]|uniref:flavin reductase family protein n=1 Tax=Pseudoalteromonas sp. CNC9-20 TaxID=2917750 RepID=UPI001EF610BA|nr:flavin reductase [Pseudoalteromonas sp. CNC9-20]MCG7569324.1 flavin reductase [Pseudoalteromonas sp. CNC9-20]